MKVELGQMMVYDDALGGKAANELVDFCLGQQDGRGSILVNDISYLAAL